MVAHVLVALVLLLVAARAGGALAERLGQPAVLGELLAGIVLGALPLAGVGGLAWIPRDHVVEALADSVVDDPETIQRYLNSIRSDVASLNSLIDDLFELAQLDAGGLKFDMVSVSLSDLISDVLERMRALAERRGVALNQVVLGNGSKNVEKGPLGLIHRELTAGSHA